MITDPPFPHTADIWPAARPIIDDTAEHPAIGNNWPPPHVDQLTWRSDDWTTHKTYLAGHYYEIQADGAAERWTVLHAKELRFIVGDPMITIGQADNLDEAQQAAERHLQTELALAGAIDALAAAHE